MNYKIQYAHHVFGSTYNRVKSIQYVKMTTLVYHIDPKYAPRALKRIEIVLSNMFHYTTRTNFNRATGDDRQQKAA